MKIRQIFALFLVLVMLAAVFTSCAAPADPAKGEDPYVAPQKTTPLSSQKITNVKISAEGHSAIESFAVAELKWYFNAKSISVSDDGYPITLSIDPTVTADGYKTEADENGLTIKGGTARGLAYGFYSFLEKYVGVHFYAANTVVVDDKDVVIEMGLIDSFDPAFDILRNPWYPIEALPEKDGGNSAGSNRMTKRLTLGTITGNGGIAQPCLTDPENLPKAIKYVTDYLTATPGLKTISLAPNDGSDYYCQCPNCARIDKEEGSHAGSYIRFINSLIAAVSADYPTVNFEINIRTYLQAAPAITKPADGVSVRLGTAGCCVTHPITDTTCPETVAFAQAIETWGTLCDSVHLDYVLTASTDYIPVFANLGTLRENMRFFAESGIQSIYCSGNFACPSGEFGELRVYLISKLLLDPMMSEEQFNAYMNDFLKAFYGEGWTYIRNFIDKITELAADGHQNATGSPFDGITEEEYLANEETFDGWWNQAEALAGDRIDFVKRARYQWRYIKLCLHPNAEDAQALIADVSNPAAKVSWREKQWNVDESSDLNLAPTEWKYKS